MAVIDTTSVQLYDADDESSGRCQREIVKGAKARSTQLGHETNLTPQSSSLPIGAIDTHVHIFDPRLGPYSSCRAYTPANAFLTHLRSFSQELSVNNQPANFVFVQPSTYGTDNQVLMAVLKSMKEDGCFARGIAVIDLDNTTIEELNQMHSLGVRGVRLNLQSHGMDVDVSQLKLKIQAAAARIKHLDGWKVQLFAPACVWKDIYSTVFSLPVAVIADHVGGLLGSSKLAKNLAHTPLHQAGFAALITLAKSSRVWIKISGLYRCSSEDSTGYSDMASIIHELAREVPDNLIWGSDWPHTGEGKDRLKSKDVTRVEAFRKIDDVRIVEHLREWVGDEEAWLKMTVQNPRRVFE